MEKNYDAFFFNEVEEERKRNVQILYKCECKNVYHYILYVKKHIYIYIRYMYIINLCINI